MTRLTEQRAPLGVRTLKAYRTRWLTNAGSELVLPWTKAGEWSDYPQTEIWLRASQMSPERQRHRRLPRTGNRIISSVLTRKVLADGTCLIRKQFPTALELGELASNRPR